jgi:hypothetical protein
MVKIDRPSSAPAGALTVNGRLGFVARLHDKTERRLVLLFVNDCERRFAKENKPADRPSLS